MFALIWTPAALLANNFTHIDYLPTYRSLEKQTIISHIEYGKQELIVHFCRVAAHQNETASFAAGGWQLNGASSRSVQNVRLNDELKALKICGSERLDLKLQRGEVLVFQVHFLLPEPGTRPAQLQGGSFDGQGLAFNDLLLKAQDHRFLGHFSDLPANIRLFYSKCAFVARPDLLRFTTIEEETERQWLQAHTDLASKPIRYEPRVLRSAADLECSRRVILEDIRFEDNSAQYQREVDANQILALIVAYMNEHPQAKLFLHGHSDVLGDAERNRQLSLERVQVVKRSLRLMGIAPERIVTLAYGGSQPLAAHTKGGAPNRRVEAEILCREPDEPLQIEISEVKYRDKNP